jgi:hypothetical protein
MPRRANSATLGGVGGVKDPLMPPSETDPDPFLIAVGRANGRKKTTYVNFRRLFMLVLPFLGFANLTNGNTGRLAGSVAPESAGSLGELSQSAGSHEYVPRLSIELRSMLRFSFCQRSGTPLLDAEPNTAPHRAQKTESGRISVLQVAQFTTHLQRQGPVETRAHTGRVIFRFGGRRNEGVSAKVRSQRSTGSSLQHREPMAG